MSETVSVGRAPGEGVGDRCGEVDERERGNDFARDHVGEFTAVDAGDHDPVNEDEQLGVRGVWIGVRYRLCECPCHAEVAGSGVAPGVDDGVGDDPE